jgi:hypothetical protein
MVKNIRKNKYLPLFFIILVWVTFSSPYLFLGKVPYPSDYQVNKFIPWSQDETLLGPVKNEAMPDVIGQLYPWRYFTISQWRQGEVPFWNPYSFAGTPHLANYQSAVFSPFNLLFFILPFIDAWSINVLLQPLIAGLGTYMFLRAKKASRIASVIGAVTFMFSGFIVVWMAYGTLAMAAAFLPLTLFAIEKFYSSKKNKYILLLIASITTSFFAGHFQTSLYVFLFSCLYAVFLIRTEKFSLRSALLLTAGFLISIIISSVQIIPTITFYQQAIRETLKVTSGGIPLIYLITSVAPDFFGNPVTRNNWYGLYAEWASFVGVIPLSLALFAFLSKQKKEVVFFAISSVAFLLLAADSILQKILIASSIPIFSTSMPSRIIVLCSFSIAILSAFGSDALINSLKNKEYRKIIPIFLSVLGILLLILIYTYTFSNIPTEYKMTAIKNMILPVGLLIGVLVIIVASTKFTIVRTYAVPILLILLSFDSLRFATKWIPFSERELVYKDLKVLEFLQQDMRHGRVVGNYAAYVDTYYQIPSLEGFDSLYIKRYGEFIEAAVDGEYHTPQRNTVHLARKGQYADRVLKVLGVTHFFHIKNDKKKEWTYPVWSDAKKYKKIYADADFEVYKYTQPLPRARMYYDVATERDDTKLLKKFYSEDFDYNKTLLLEEIVDVGGKKGQHSIVFLKDQANTISIKVMTSAEGMLFLADPYYPNWKAKVNGKEEKIYRANYAFRAVKVPKGESKVEFYYTYL